MHPSPFVFSGLALEFCESPVLANNSMNAYIVTGAGSGIGQSIALKIASLGHQVFGLGRDSKKLENTGRLIGSKNFVSASVNLANANESSRAVQEARKWLASNELKLAGLVNNAGVVDRLPFDQTSDAIWERQFENNLLSAVRLTRDLYSELKASKGSVLNISSNLGLRPIPNMSAYSAMKAAMISWTHSLAAEWAKDQIRVNCLCPGLVDTPIHSFFGLAEETEARQMAHKLSPLGRMGTSHEIAEAAWFLLSDASSWTTGSIVSVDGGMGL